jgi:hypothetical protein
MEVGLRTSASAVSGNGNLHRRTLHRGRRGEEEIDTQRDEKTQSEGVRTLKNGIDVEVLIKEK